MRQILAGVLLLMMLALAPAAAQTGGSGADDIATLIADRLRLDGPDQLVAEGNVEVLFGTARLRAQRIAYDRGTGRIVVTGPLTLDQGREVLFLAEQAELSDDLQSGLIRAARLVLDEQLQIAAATINRRGDRFTEMENIVASSCEICARSQTPLWEIRASRVIHDEEELQVRFENAQFRFLGVPIAYLPRLRVPDPRLRRTTGFLGPQAVLDTGHGLGLRSPYFIVLSPARDLTVTPFLASKGTRALELRYRQAFANGRLEFGGLVGRDQIRPGGLRGFGYATGQVTLPGAWRLGFNLIHPSDRQLLDDYNRGEPRLTSDITLEQVRRDRFIRVQALQFRSLLRSDDNALLPNQVGQAVLEQRRDMAGVGGVFDLRLEAHLHRRARALPPSLPAPRPGFGPGPRPRETARVSLDLGWRNDAVLPGGVLAATGAHLGLDHVTLWSADGAFSRSEGTVTPALTAELRWPLIAQGQNGVTHVIEPVGQVVWSPDRNPELPVDESRMPELDEGNLFRLNRFPANDVRERGLRTNLGLRWTMTDPSGWSSGLALGRVFRQRDLGQFSAASPLAGARSNWLVSGSIDTATGLSLSNRALFDDDLGLERTALEVDWTRTSYSLSTSFLRVRANPFEDRADPASEWRLDASRVFDDRWTARIGWRYDVAQSQAARANFGLDYENECLRVALGVERQFATASRDTPSTNLGLNIDILGIGGNPGAARRSCAAN